jgi:hypothetical protein
MPLADPDGLRPSGFLDPTDKPQENHKPTVVPKIRRASIALAQLEQALRPRKIAGRFVCECGWLLLCWLAEMSMVFALAEAARRLNYASVHNRFMLLLWVSGWAAFAHWAVWMVIFTVRHVLDAVITFVDGDPRGGES